MVEVQQHFFRDVSPYRLVSDLGIQIHAEKGRFWINHSMLPKTRLFITEQEFVAESFDNGFVAGDIFDFLCLHLGSYSQAVHHMAEYYSGQNLMDSDLAKMTEQMTAKRSRFLAWMSLRTNLTTNVTAMSPAVIWLKKNGAEAGHAAQMLYAATGKRLTAILDKETFSESLPDLEPNSIYIVLPYFANYRTVSGVILRHASDQNFVKNLQFQPARYSYFGLHSRLPGTFDCRVFGNPLLALEHHTYVSETGQANFGCLHVKCDPEHYQAPMKIDRGVFVLTSNNPVSEIVKVKAAFGSLEVADMDKVLLSRDTIEARSWRSFIANALLAFVGDGKTITPVLMGFVDNLRHDQETLDWFLELISKKYPKLRAQIDRSIMDRNFTVFGGIQITDTDAGLFASRGASKARVQFTNFTIRFDRSIWFETTQELFYSGQVLFNGSSYPVKISRLALNRPADIERIACTAVLPGLQEGGKGTPSILDVTFKSKLSAHLIQRSANASRVTGVDFIGWDRSRSKFTAPTWQADAYGIHATSCAGHSGIDHFTRHYSFKRLAFVEDTSAIPSEVKYLIAILMSMLARSFLNLPSPIVNVTRSPDSLSLMRALFIPFGQVHPVELNPNVRYDIHKELDKCANGYPAYGYGNMLQEFAENGLGFPFFFLGSKGLSFNSKLDNNLHHQIYSLVNQVISKLLVGMIRENRKVQSLVKSEAIEIDDMIHEGNQLFAHYCDPSVTNFATIEFPIFYQFLSGITLETVPKYFEFDLTTQTVVINTRNFTEVRRFDLTSELKMSEPKSRNVGRYSVELPVEFASKILRRFYGQQVKFSNKSDGDSHQDTEESPRDDSGHLLSS